MHLLSASGTLDMILVLLVVWLLLRMVTRLQGPPATGGGTGAPPRRKGEVRIEQVKERKRNTDLPDVEDADFEEIK